jgi:hypothetical protein
MTLPSWLRIFELRVKNAWPAMMGWIRWLILTMLNCDLPWQVASLIMARRLLSLWHTIHIPIGLVLFATAFIHILGALYYATLLR